MAANNNQQARRELGTFVLAFIKGSGGTLTPEKISELALGIVEICAENGIAVSVNVPKAK